VPAASAYLFRGPLNGRDDAQAVETILSSIGIYRHVYAFMSGSRMKLSAWAKKEAGHFLYDRVEMVPRRAARQCAPSRWRQEPSSSTTKRRRPLPLLSTRVFPVTSKRTSSRPSSGACSGACRNMPREKN